MREYLDKRLRQPAGLLLKTDSRARVIVVLLALSGGGLPSGAAPAQTLRAPAGSLAPMPDSVSPAEGDAKAPEVTRRLRRALLCTRPEKDCVHESLDACTCPYAQKGRREMLDEVKRRGFGPTKQDDATYEAVFTNYSKARGEAADVSRPSSQPSSPLWIDIVLTTAAAATALNNDHLDGGPLPANPERMRHL